MTRRAKWWWGGAAVAVVLATGLSAGAILIFRSEWFAEKVRARIIEETERASGGRAELRKFSFDWRTLTASVRDFTLRGEEPAGSPPLFQADSIRVRLRIISALRRKVDLAALEIDRPSLYILVRPDGSTNIPRPKVQRLKRGFLETVLDLRIKQISLAGGAFQIAERRLPVDVSAKDLDLRLGYEPSEPRYEGRLRTRELIVGHTIIRDVPLDLEATVSLAKDRITVARAVASRKDLKVEMQGFVAGLASPEVDFSGKAAANVAEVQRFRSLPLEGRGRLEADFRFTYRRADGYALAGVVSGAGLVPAIGGFDAGAVKLKSKVRLAGRRVEFDEAEVAGNVGVFHGGGSVDDWRLLTVQGRVENVAADETARRAGRTSLAYPMMLNGPVELRGEIDRGTLSNIRVKAELEASSKPGSGPVDGLISFTYDEQSGRIVFEPSRLTLSATEVRAAGSLDERLAVEVETSDLKEALGAAAVFGGPPSLPVEMRGGRASFRGEIRRAIHEPRISGSLAATRLIWQGMPIDEVDADLSISSQAIEARRISARQNTASLTGSGKVALENWSPPRQGPVSARFELKDAAVGPWLKWAGSQADFDAVVSASGAVSGSFESPQVEFRFDARQGRAGKERFDRFQGTAKLGSPGFELLTGRLTLGSSLVRLEGSYSPSRNSWTNGVLRVKAASDTLALERIALLSDFVPGVRGNARVEVDAAARVEAGSILLRCLDGALSTPGLSVNGKNLGSLRVDARSRREAMKIQAEMALRGSKAFASADVTLDGDYPAQGEIRLDPVEIETLFELAEEKKNTPPATGKVRARASFSGPLRDFAKIKGAGEISSLELKPREILEPGGKTAPLDLTVHNEGPIGLELAGGVIRIRRSRLTAQKTDVFVEGSYAPKEKSPLELRLRGDLNLATLRGLKPELRIGGTSVVDVVVRGTIQSPDVAGKLELRNASLFLADVPNGLDNANGVLTFDRNRITVQQITAESGGGRVTIGGFLGLGGEDLTYRLQAVAERVRVRYPEGFSTLLDAKLSFTGTRRKSLLAGTATVLRSSFSSRQDLASLFQPAAQAVTAPVTPSEFLRGLQFDVQLISGQDFEIQTAYTQNVQAEARLQLRGTAAKPSLLGRLSCGDGEVDFLGTRYRINRAEINFYNTSKIEPVLDVALETRIRGISVNISLSGTINRLNVTYRSDPPLSSTEILALLTAGRTPASDRGMGLSTPNSQDPTTVGSAILGQALSVPVSSRLQRFFGVSRVKIDPLARGLEGTQQARLTVEQQISRDVTLTYVTSLQRVEQQIVRVEINLNRQLSLVALRDENGAFGVDFYYRKRLR